MAVLLIIFLFIFQTQELPNPEKVYGSIYITSNPLDADVRVYTETTEGFADPKVFRVGSRIFANKSGLWHLTKDKGHADYVIYFEKDNPGAADFSVFYVESVIFAGVE